MKLERKEFMLVLVNEINLLIQKNITVEEFIEITNDFKFKKICKLIEVLVSYCNNSDEFCYYCNLVNNQEVLELISSYLTCRLSNLYD